MWQLFEGNLNSARHSLPVAQSMSMASLRAPPDMPSLPTPPREHVNYAGLVGPVDSSNSGHSRGFSEASASSFIQQLLVARQQRKQTPQKPPPQRSFSALATHTQQNNHVRNSKSQELMREHRIKSWVFGDAQESLASPAYSEAAISREEIKRSPSTTNDLRAQMNDLKGKISSLQQRAKDENLRRRSYASLRSQSAASYHDGSPLQSEMSRAQSSLHHYNTKTARSLDTADSFTGDMPGAYADSQNDSVDEDALAEIDNESPEARKMLNETLSELEDQSVYDSADEESVYQSVFEEELVEPAARHEDRADAFDYENFFLHSAMGSYTRDRSGSVSSADSVETTKPVAPGVQAAVDEEDMMATDPRSLHRRHASTESISTLATFMTATEGNEDSDNEEDEDSDDGQALDNALSGLSGPQLAVPVTLNQRDSGVAMSPDRNIAKRSKLSSVTSNASDASEQEEMVLSQTGLAMGGNHVPLQAQDLALVQALSKSLGELCLALKGTDSGQYEGKLLRRRLHDARRVLEGLD